MVYTAWYNNDNNSTIHNMKLKYFNMVKVYLFQRRQHPVSLPQLVIQGILNFLIIHIYWILIETIVFTFMHLIEHLMYFSLIFKMCDVYWVHIGNICVNSYSIVRIEYYYSMGFYTTARFIIPLRLPVYTFTKKLTSFKSLVF